MTQFLSMTYCACDILFFNACTHAYHFHYTLWKWQCKHSIIGTRISNYFHYPTTNKTVFCFLRSYDLFNPTLTQPHKLSPCKFTNLICSCKISFQVKNFHHIFLYMLSCYVNLHVMKSYEGLDSIVFYLESKNLSETINMYHLHRPEEREREREQPIAKTIWSGHSLPQVLKHTGILIYWLWLTILCTLMLRSIQIHMLVAPDMYPLSNYHPT